jgi:hypothetical protein
MNLKELKDNVDRAIKSSLEYGYTPEEVIVSLQVEGPGEKVAWASEEVELIYDNDCCASGCVLRGENES